MPKIIACGRCKQDKSMFEISLGDIEPPHLKKTKEQGCSAAADHVTSMCKVLGSSTIITEKRRKGHIWIYDSFSIKIMLHRDYKIFPNPSLLLAAVLKFRILEIGCYLINILKYVGLTIKPGLIRQATQQKLFHKDTDIHCHAISYLM